MAKAFDSVHLNSLDLSLKRIGMPHLARSFIINLFKNRKLSVITTFGNSPVFEAGDGIDQGEAISSLLWRIFYDPLLAYIQHRTDQGFTHELTIVDNINPLHYTHHH